MSTSAIETFTKKPAAVLDYVVDWSDWLATNDTLAAVTWDVPSGLTQPTPATNTTTSATVWIGGGTAGVDYVVTCSVTTAQGRTDARSFVLRVRG